jgi:hypothetical protein
MKSLKLFGLSLVFTLALIITASAQLTGTKNVPGDYATLVAAVTDLNTQGVGVGGVTINLVAGNPQTAPAGGYVIGGTGSVVLTTSSAANPIVFAGNGNVITAPNPQASGALNDGIFKLIGADWVTISGFSMLENAANTTTAAGTNNMTEWGVALLYVTTTDGAQNNTIQNNTIDLDRTYQNTFGIYSNSTHSATAVTTSATATTTAGGNTGLKIYGNGITDVNNGIVVVGPTAVADQNDNIDIGGAAAGTGNTVTNFGTTPTFSGYANVSGTVNGILSRNAKNYNIRFNTVTSSNGGMTVSGTMNGIQIPASTNAPTGTLTQAISNNGISLRPGVAAATIIGINMPSSSVNATTTLSISNNDFNTFGHTVAGTGAITFISGAAAALNSSINSNTFTNITVNTTGNLTFINKSVSHPASAVINVNNNSIVGTFSKTGAGGTVQFYESFGTTPSTATESNSGNNFSNATFTGATTLTLWRSADGSASSPFGPVKTVSNNTFSNITGGTSAIQVLIVTLGGTAGTNTVAGNTISGISSAGAITGLTTGTTSGGSHNWTSNTINGFTSTGASVVSGMVLNGTLATQNISKNKIYDLTANNAAGTVNGILVSTSAVTGNIFNNLIGDLKAPITSSTNAINGINVTSTTVTTTTNVSFNSIWINATSSGVNFGTTGVGHTTSATATTSALVLRSNNIVNLSTPAGTGTTAAIRRSSTTLTNFGTASNNNNYYAGTPGVSNLIFTDGTNNMQTIATYKALAGVSPRDSNSVSENPTFVSTVGSNPNFLHINTATPTQLEGGGVTVAGITDDFDGDTRAGTPDIGADEFAGILLDLVGPNITYVTLSNTSSTGDRVLTISVTDPSGVASGPGAPGIQYKKNAGPYVGNSCIFVSGSTYTCNISAAALGGLTTGDTVSYYVLAQDNANNVSANPSGGAGGFTPNPPSAATPPTVPNSYSIVTAISGSFNVGAAQPFTSLTNTGGLFEALNAAEITGNITINITSDLAGELGTVPLNEFGGAFSVLIRPSGAPRQIATSAATSLIKLAGADNVTIDGSLSGGTDRSLTFTSTGAGAFVWNATNATSGANGNTVKNCIFSGPGAFAGQGVIAGSGAVFGNPAEFPNSNFALVNNAFSRIQNAVFQAGTAATPDQNWTITDNNVGSAVVADKLSFRGFLVQNIQNFLIARNVISGINSSTGTTSTMSGITAAGVLSGTIERNMISDIKQNNTAGWGSNGIDLSGAGAATANVTVQNNFVSDVASQGFNDITVLDNGYGIMIESNGTYNILNNTVLLTSNQGANAATGNTSALNIAAAVTTPATVTVRNNILGSTQTLGNRYGIINGSTAAVFSTSNNNDFFAQNVGRTGGTTHATLLAWQTATTQDAASVTLDPLVVSATDLHLQAGSPVLGLAVLLPTVPADIDTDLRDNAPDIGADEIPLTGRTGAIPAGTYRDGYLGAATLSGNVSFTGVLNLTGITDAGANTLTLTCTASVTGAGTSNYIVGNLRKDFCSSGAFTFPVGTTPNGSARSSEIPEGSPGEYSPMTATINPSSILPSSLVVNVVDTWLPGLGQTSSTSRYWNVSEIGDITADMTFQYLPEDVYGVETSYKVFKYDGVFTTQYATGTVNAGLNQFTAPLVTSFSGWAAGVNAVTAATANISGRVLTSGGMPISNVKMVLTGGELDGARIVYTGSLGYYNFENLPVGQNYVITVKSRRFFFSNPSHLHLLTDSINDGDFIADPQ